MNSIEPLLINCFIALMLFIFWAWDLPERNLCNRLAMKLQWPVERLSLFHHWRMFSPDPFTDNYRLQFRLHLADSSVAVIEPEYFRFPAAQRQPVCHRWTKIKMSLLWEESGPLRGSVCRYVAAEFQAQAAAAQQPDKQPVKVELVRWRQPVAPLAAQATAQANVSREPYKRRIIYTQPISRESLVAATVSAASVSATNFVREQLC